MLKEPDGGGGVGVGLGGIVGVVGVVVGVAVGVGEGAVGVGLGDEAPPVSDHEDLIEFRYGFICDKTYSSGS